jgi:FkbM family methyltransferase
VVRVVRASAAQGRRVPGDAVVTLKSVRFDPFELGLVAVTITAIVLSLHRPGHVISLEADWLARTYGPTRQSQFYEEWIVRDFFTDRRGGVFVDIGASDPRQFSNTWYLERVLGWSGIAVDAQAQYAPMYAAERPRTRFRSFFVSDRSSEEVRLFLNETPLVASSTPAFTERWGQLRKAETVTTVTLDDLLAAERVSAVDFLTIDIELAEPQALAGFTIERFKPRLVCIEAHPEVRQRILDYFAAHDYVVVGKYLRLDDDNLWFMPRDATVTPFPSEIMAGWRTGH